MSLSAQPNAAIENRLLAALPREDYQRLLPHLQPIQVALGEVIYESGPTAEMGLADSDGIVGVALFLGGETTPNRAVAQIGGGALRMKAQLLQEEFRRGGPLQFLLLRYTASADHPDLADSRVQPSSLGRATPRALAAAVPRPREVRRTAHDARVGVDRATTPAPRSLSRQTPPAAPARSGQRSVGRRAGRSSPRRRRLRDPRARAPCPARPSSTPVPPRSIRR